MRHSCAVANDEARYQRQLDADEADAEWQGAAADKIACRWYHEYEATTRIDDLDLEQRDIEFYLLHGPSSDIFELLADLALSEVRNNQSKYKPEPDYEALSWG